MFVEASAIFSIIKREEGYEELVRRIEEAQGQLFTSPLSRFEVTVSLARQGAVKGKKPSPEEVEKCESLIEAQKIKSNLIINKEITELETRPIYDLLPPMSTIYISGGKRDKLRPGDIVGAIVGEAGIDFKDIGKVSVTKILSFAAIKTEFVEKVIQKLNAGKIKKRKFKVGLIS